MSFRVFVAVHVVLVLIVLGVFVVLDQQHQKSMQYHQALIERLDEEFVESKAHTERLQRIKSEIINGE